MNQSRIALAGGFRDVSPDFIPNRRDSDIMRYLLRYEATPEAIIRFAEECHRLTDYGYWFTLSTLWVSYSGYSDLKLWKRLFKGIRANRKTSLMKPSEVEAYDGLPEHITAYRAHRDGETDWISYTLSRDIAERFARERGVSEIAQYSLRKRDVIALFLRRGEQEVIVLHPSRAKLVAKHEIGVMKRDGG